MPTIPSSQPTFAGAEATAGLIRSWLIDGEGTRSGLVGVNRDLQAISVHSFPHGLCEASFAAALSEAVRASARGIVAYVVSEKKGDGPDGDMLRAFADISDSAHVTLLDVIIYSPTSWTSARQKNLL